jgi:chemotaxis protein MotB
VTVTDDGKRILDKIWSALAAYPDKDILVEGHTDNVPIAQKYQGKYKSNWELSCARSLAVLHYLRGQAGANPARYGAVGYGEYRPVGDNSTEAGRKQNRRVVIVVAERG